MKPGRARRGAVPDRPAATHVLVGTAGGILSRVFFFAAITLLVLSIVRKLDRR